MFSGSEKEQALEILRMYGLPTSGGSYWWTRYPIRAVDEVYKMEENTSASLLFTKTKLIWEEVIENNFGSLFLISIEARSGFPFNMPKVFVKEPHIIPSTEIHMYLEDSRLCLMHPNVFSSQMPVLDFRNQACSWCECYEIYQNTGEWPAAEHQH